MALPTQNSNESVTKGNGNVKIKLETPEDEEIREMAEKMQEVNKQKMAIAQAAANTNANTQNNLIRGGQSTINSYFNKIGVTATPATKSDDESDKPKKEPLDTESVKGRFGWTMIGKEHIPYLFRKVEHYCVVRIIEKRVLFKYLTNLSSDIHSCTCIRSYYITDVEAKLLTEINVRHADNYYGSEPFTTKDLVVRVEDAEQFYCFLDLCYAKLMFCTKTPQDRCGFIKINGESVVPFTVRDNVRYVPLFYFEGEIDSLREKAVLLEGWDLAYLKFCCKVQGIRNELFSNESCSVISINDIRSYFPPGTSFEDYWPGKLLESQLLLPQGRTANAPVQGGQWTRQPVGKPTPSPAPQPTPQPAKPPTTINNRTPAIASLSNVVRSIPNGNHASNSYRAQQYTMANTVPTTSAMAANRGLQNTMTNSAVYNGYNMSAANIRQYQQAQVVNQYLGQHYALSQPSATIPVSPMLAPHSESPVGGAVGPPPPLLHGPAGQALTNAANRHITHTSQQQMMNSAYMNMMVGNSTMANTTAQHLQPQTQQRPTQQLNTKTPPPLVPMTNGVKEPSTGAIDLSSSGVTNPPTRTSSSTGGVNRDGLIVLPETMSTGPHAAFRIQKALVEGRMIECINAKPFVSGELLLTISDLVANFFPDVPEAVCRQVFKEVLHVSLYQGNYAQMDVLYRHGKCRSVRDTLPLVPVRDLMQYMPQLKYMLAKRGLNIAPPPQMGASAMLSTAAKRHRIS